jgi:hypothetical protein
MTGEPGAKGAPRPSTDGRAPGQDVLGLSERERDYLLAWVGENLTLVRRSASGQRPMYWVLVIGFVIGLAAHIETSLRALSRGPAEFLCGWPGRSG